MLKIGCHLSSSKGYEAMGRNALKIGANTFQFFTRNPRGGSAAEISRKDADNLKKLMEEHSFAPILAHAPYTLNLCSAKPDTRRFAKAMMKDDLCRMEQLPAYLYNFHPGSHTGQGVDTGIEQIVEALNEIITEDQQTIVLLETMAGKGSEIGGRFEELRAIIDGVERQDKIGVCLDTCHIFDGGYDLVNDLDGVIAAFDNTIGLDRLKTIHLNDSMNPKGSHKDRHAKIGEGNIGIEALSRIINHPALRDLPFYLETPNELDGYGNEIKLMKHHYIPS
ncbi:MAG: deoxyribonuclease IV [Prevotellaceae bacterium]|jgi:deoxyribonuclease-4|nr:deoxyribonuclease IV [Prevotellaceae bacterium]